MPNDLKIIGSGREQPDGPRQIWNLSGRNHLWISDTKAPDLIPALFPAGRLLQATL